MCKIPNLAVPTAIKLIQISTNHENPSTKLQTTSIQHLRQTQLKTKELIAILINL
jgi:hypothetical protein